MGAGTGSSDIYLAVRAKRAGRIKGEVTVAGHEDDIAVSSWRWAVQASSALGSGQSTGRRSYSGVTIVKSIDSATTSLMSALATNDEIKEAVLSMRKVGGESMDFLLVTLKEARITQIEHAAGDTGTTHEIVTIAFRKVEVEYRRQQSGGGRGASSVFSDEVIPSA